MKRLFHLSLIATALIAFNVAAQTNANQKLTVKVQDFSGQPMAGATVEYYAFVGDKTGKPKVETTGSDGLVHFAVERGGGQVAAHKAGMGIDLSLYSLKDAQPIVLTLGQSRSISGTVLDESEKPVADVKVNVSYITFDPDKVRQRTGSLYIINSELQNRLSGQTGPDGVFRIDGIPTNSTLGLSVKKSGKALVKPERNPPVTYRAGQQDITIRMQTAGSIAGKVLIPGGEYDIPDLVVTLLDPQSRGTVTHQTKLAADGSFRFEDVAPGSYQIVARFGSRNVPDWVAKNASASVQSGKETRDIAITATKGGVLEIATFSSDGHKPLAGVNFFLSGQQSQSGTTDSDGVALVRAVPGTYTVTVNKDGAQAGDPAQVQEGKTNRLELELTMPNQISGTVRDTNGSPAVGIEVTLYNFNLQSATTDSNGHYRVLLTLDRHARSPFVMVQDRARNLAAVKDIEEGTPVYDLQLAPGVAFSGRVQDEQGKPVPNARVNVVVWGGSTGWSIESGSPPKTDAQGRFETRAWPIGRRYSLEISAKGYGTASVRAQQIDTTRFEFDTLTLPLANKKIAGIVVDASNNPIPGTEIFMSGDRQPRSNTKTDQQGRFEINEVCDGLVRISANTQGEPFLNANTQAEAGDTNIVIMLGEQSGSMPSRPRRPSLVGKPLPDLTSAGFSAGLLQTNKPLLVCIFDPEQRPSRRAVRLLGDQYDSLKQKNLTVLGLFATPTTADALKGWKQSNPVPFPVSGATEAGDKAKWILSIEKFPWLILTDTQGRVKAEGFDLDELDAKLK